MPKVFIFNGTATSSICVDDTAELFKRYEIVKSADVLTTDFNMSFDGLNPSRENITLVIPGGSAINMSTSLRKTQPAVDALVKRGSNYVGICAGGYLATNDASLYKPSYTFLAYDYEPPNYQTSWKHENYYSLGICQDYSAIGPFYPDSISYLLELCYGHDQFSERDLQSQKIKPSCVELSFNNGKKIPQLYAGGCGFELTSIQSIPLHQQHQVVAHYPKTYTFIDKNKPASTKQITNLPAIITRTADREHHQGNSFIAGTHIEACVENSKLIQFFRQASRDNLPLQKKDLKQLTAGQEQAREEIIPLLKTTLNR